MKVIDFHVHLATVQDWTPAVMAFIRENNPEYFEQFAGGPDPEGVVAYFASQGVTQTGHARRVRAEMHRRGHQ